MEPIIFEISPMAGFLLICLMFVVSGISFMMGIVCHDSFVQEIRPEDEEKYFPPKKQ